MLETLCGLENLIWFTADGDVEGEGQGVDLDPAIAAEHVGAAVGEIRKEF